MKEKVILTAFAITQPGQIKHFQVKIPRDAKRIIGIEASASRTEPVQTTGGISGGGGPAGGGGTGGTGFANPFGLLLNQDTLLGEFRLQSCGSANIFYAGTLFLGDNNEGQGYFSSIPQFTPKEFTHSPKRTEDKVNEDGSATLLKGIYRDGQSAAAGGYTYTVKIYVWVELNCKET